MIGREEELRIYRDRVGLFYAIVAIAFGLILFRLFYLQVLKGDDLRRYSEANRLKKERLFPTRGIIYDREGKVIVDSRASFDVVLFSQYYPFKAKTNKRLAKALDIPLKDLERKLKKARKRAAFHSLLLKADVPPDIIAAIEMDAEGFPGVDIEATVQRRYPFDDLAAQLLGYVGEVDKEDIRKSKKTFGAGDYIGKMGIERRYDQYLRGHNGMGYVEVDARGHRRKTEKGEKLLGYIAQTDPVPGHNIYLTLDLDLELAARKALLDRGFNGSVVALDPRSGEILAMVNSPSYHPGVISGREIDAKVWRELSQNKERPLRNRAIQDHYPPGSTFKLFLAIAGLAEGLVDLKHTINCKGYMRFGGRRFHCWKRHGKVDYIRAIRESCDVFFYKLGDALGIERIAKYSRLFGFGKRSGIKLAGEQRGLIPDTAWKKKIYNDIWHPGETLSVAIGQGFVAVTPLQLVSAFSAISNGGFLYRPYIVRKIERLGGKTIREYQPELTRKIEIPSEVFEAAKEGLFQVVNAPWGTGARTRSRITVISGKTGTAQVRNFADIKNMKCEKAEVKDRHHGLFAGYAPRENPEIVVVAVAEHACHGSSAGPVIKDVIETYIKKQADKRGLPLSAKKKEVKERIKEYKKRSEIVAKTHKIVPIQPKEVVHTESKNSSVPVLRKTAKSEEDEIPLDAMAPMMGPMNKEKDSKANIDAMSTENEN